MCVCLFVWLEDSTDLGIFYDGLAKKLSLLKLVVRADWNGITNWETGYLMINNLI